MQEVKPGAGADFSWQRLEGAGTDWRVVLVLGHLPKGGSRGLSASAVLPLPTILPPDLLSRALETSPSLAGETRGRGGAWLEKSPRRSSSPP